MKSTHRLFFTFLVLCSFLLTGITLTPPAGTIASQTTRLPAMLPIFKLAAPDVSESKLEMLSKVTLGMSGGAKRLDGALVAQSDDKVVEIDMASGAMWAARQSQLWNPELKPQLPDDKKARSAADDFLSKNSLLPKQDLRRHSVTAYSHTTSTQTATYDVATRRRSAPRKLDVQVNYATKVDVSGIQAHLPVVGGGGDFSVTFGDKGELIGFQGLWRPIEGIETESRVIPKARADEQFKQMVKGLRIRKFRSELAYYSAPIGVEQRSLYPVWVYSGTAIVGNEDSPMRLIMIPATEYGPKIKTQEPPRKRTGEDKPRPGATEPEDKQTREKGTPGGKHHSSPSDPRRQDGILEGASSYIGVSQGLSGSKANAEGFVNGLTADGWSQNFLWGDANAFESDWRVNDDSWLDTADWVFYTGHASMNSWNLSNPDDGSLHFSEVGATPQNPGDMWGQQDLEWVIIAACGPLQDTAVNPPGGGNVFNRWRGAFDGLHQLMGYSSVSADNEDEGRLVTKYAKQNHTIKYSWFRAAKEVQNGTNSSSPPDGPIIYVAIVYATKSGVDPLNDHMWGHGSVSGDPTSPTSFTAMWSGC